MLGIAVFRYHKKKESFRAALKAAVRIVFCLFARRQSGSSPGDDMETQGGSGSGGGTGGG